MFTRNEERVGARALMSSRDHEHRIRYVQRFTDFDRERAEALLTECQQLFDSKVGRTRAFVEIMSTGADDLKKTTLAIQLGLALMVGGLGVYFFASDRAFLGVVCVGVVVANFVVAYQARNRKGGLTR